MATSETSWVSLSDLTEVLSAEVLDRLDANVGLPTGSPLDSSSTSNPLRSKQLVSRAVAEWRGALRAGGRVPVSLQTDSVAPESVPHVLWRAVSLLMNSKPSLIQVLQESQPDANALMRDAKRHVDSVRAGLVVSQPTYPAGQDGATAPAADNPDVSGAVWGDQYADDTDYAAGYVTDPQTGETAELPLDDLSVIPTYTLAAEATGYTAVGNTGEVGDDPPTDPPPLPSYPDWYYDRLSGATWKWDPEAYAWVL